MIISLTQYQLLVVFRGPISLVTGYLYLEIFIPIYQVIFKFINLSLYLLGRKTCIRLLLKRWEQNSTQMSIQKSVGRYYYPGKEKKIFKTYWTIHKKNVVGDYFTYTIPTSSCISWSYITYWCWLPIYRNIYTNLSSYFKFIYLPLYLLGRITCMRLSLLNNP